MADLQAALATQLRNIQSRTGQSLAQFRDVIAASGLVKHGEVRAMLMERFGLGHGDANTLAHAARAAEATPATAGLQDAEPLDALYTGPKAVLRPLHGQVMAAIEGFGVFEIAPKKAYLSLRRKKQFAMLGPATQTQLELGLNVRGLPPHPRLKVVPPGGMCAYKVRLSSAAEVDAELVGWLRRAYDAAG